jgi:hypothetical protein
MRNPKTFTFTFSHSLSLSNSNIMISQICSSQIRDSFWFAYYGNFKCVINKQNGFINATKLCSLANKKFSDWKCNTSSMRLIQELEEEIYWENHFTQSPGELSLQYGVELNTETVCKYITTSNQTEEDRLISGTYVHPLLIPHIACWCSPSFAIKVSKVINFIVIENWKMKLLQEQQQQQQPQDTYLNSLSSLQSQDTIIVDDSKDDDDDHHHQSEINDNQQQQQHSVNNKNNKTHTFTLLRVNDVNFLPYYVIRCKRRHMNNAINKLRNHRHHQIKILYQAMKVPNSVNELDNIKKDIGGSGIVVKVKRNYCAVSDERQFIDIVSKMCSTH